MAAPLLRRRKVLGAKVEAAPGTPETIAAAQATVNVFNASFRPGIQHIEREGQGAALSPITSTFGAAGGTVTFSVEATGGATAPWASVFMPACGLGLTAGVLAPNSLPPEAAGATAKTITIAGHEDGVLKVLYGCMGNAVLRFRAGQPVMIDFAFSGCWTAPSDAALLAPTYVTTAPVRFVSTTFTVGAVAHKVGELTIDLGNNVVLREDAQTATGYHSALITGRRIRGTMTREATLVATADPHADMVGRTERALVCTLTGFALAAPKLQVTNVTPGDMDGVAADVVEFQLNRSASAGDDEMTITLS